MHWGSETNWASGTEPRKVGLPLATRRHRVQRQHSSVLKTRPSPGPSALSPFLHTSWQGRPDRHTQRLPSGHAGPAPHACRQTVSPRPGDGGWKQSRQTPSDCLPWAKLVKFKAPPGPTPPRKWGQEAATEHSACCCRGQGCWGPGPGSPRCTQIQGRTHPTPSAHVPCCGTLRLPLAWWLYPGHDDRDLPVKGTLKWLRRADRHTDDKLFLVET